MIVDTVEGVCVQTETVLRQAMQERIKPVLMINKVDRAIYELKLSGEEIYQQFQKVIDKVNVVMSNYQCEDMGEQECNPTVGNVVFGAGKDQWAFSLTTFARMHEKELGISQEILVEKLWGDHYYDPETRKFIGEPHSQSGKSLKRAFVEFIMEPICQLTRSILEGDKEAFNKII